ncbi:A disintegrin and metalloproteinase with thrombospondin motifs like isoform X1 [Cherax quadricarinatus]
MSTEDLRRVFNVELHHQAPAYDVVRLRSRLKRGADGDPVRTVYLRALGTTRVLHLRPNHDLIGRVPLFYADRDDLGRVTVTPTQYAGEDDRMGVPHQDEHSLAALLVSHHPLTSALTLDGTVGEDLVVRPLPPHLYPQATQEEEAVSPNHLPPPDDELFLDDLDDQMIFSDGLPLAGDDEDTGSVLDLQRPQDVNGINGSLPEGLTLLRRRRRHVESEGFHIVYKRATPAVDTDYALMELDHIPARSPEARPRRKRSAPYIIYPEILVLVDYDGYLLHGQDNSQIKSYYVSFWNGVDLRYKLLKGPRVKISIAGIIISRSRDAMPYLEKNRVGRDAIDSASALTDMGKYLYQERRLPTYDIAVAITKLDMCRRAFTGGVCNRGTAGFAYVGGACVVNKRLQKVNSVAIVEDTGGFSGIIVAAHEVGHLLGAVHDGSPPPSYLGGPGARRCRWEDGYIMSDLRHTEKGFRWSPCSVEQFHHFLNGDTATCLYNLPHEDESLPRVLPGKLLSLDAQCKKDRGTSACFKDDRVCAQLFCFDSSSGYCVSYRPAAEGSDCGSGKICSNGRCVYDNGNSISDFDISRSGEHFIFQSTEVKPVYTDPPSSTTPEPSTTAPRSSWWNNWDHNRWEQGSLSTPTTTTTSTIRTTTTTTPLPPKDLKKTFKEPVKVTDGECEDRIANIAGSLTCQEFLRSYGFRYCGHRYIQKNCCRSQKDMCHGP